MYRGSRSFRVGSTAAAPDSGDGGAQTGSASLQPVAEAANQGVHPAERLGAEIGRIEFI